MLEAYQQFSRVAAGIQTSAEPIDSTAHTVLITTPPTPPPTDPEAEVIFESGVTVQVREPTTHDTEHADSCIREWCTVAREKHRAEFVKSFRFPWNPTIAIARLSFMAANLILSFLCVWVVVVSVRLRQPQTWEESGQIVFLGQLIDFSLYLAGFIALVNVDLMTNVRVLYAILSVVGLLSLCASIIVLADTESTPARVTLLSTIVDVQTSFPTLLLLGCIYRCRAAAAKKEVSIEKRLEVAYHLDCSISTVLNRPRNIFVGFMFFLCFTLLAVLTVGLVFYRALHFELPGPDRGDLHNRASYASPVLMSVHTLLKGVLTPFV